METVLSPKSICNNCAAGNKGSLSWGPQGFISYGSHNIVNVVHAHSVKLVQSLENHASMVVKTAWKPPEVSYSAAERPELLLASADLAGQVVIWDIVKGSVVSTFQDAKKNIKDLHWMSPIPHNDVILVVHTNVIAAWSLKGQNCSPLWTQSFNDVLQFISPQQLSQNRLAVVGSTSIFTFYNFDYTKEQGNTGNNLVVLSQKGDVLRPKYLISPRDDRAQSADLEQCSLRDCIEFIFHPYYRDHGVLMFSRDIFIFDLELGICISNISLEKHGSSFSHVFFCVNANEFIAVHDSGQLSFRQAISPSDGKDSNSPQNSLSIHNYTPVRYTLTVQTDALRLSRQAKPLGAALEPMGERQVAVVMSSGRLYIWKLDYKLGSENLGFALNGLYSGHGGGLCCMRMAPGFATGDLTDYKPLVAMGSQTGNVQVINLSSGFLEHDFAVSPLPIVCIDWAGSNRLVCAAVIGSSSNVANGGETANSNVKNELHVVNLPSGRVVQLKSSRNDGSAIQMVTCSPSGSLAVVIYGSGAVDIWDVDTSHVVRSLSVQAASAQWARRRMHRSVSEAHDPHDDPRMSPTHTDTPSPTTMNPPAAHDELIVISISGRLLRFVFAGKSCQEKALNFDVHVTTAITSLAWKGRYIVAAELDGRIVIENIIEKRYNTISTNKNSAVKRLVFSPGRRNYSFLALYADGSCDLCNAETGEVTNSLRVRNVQAESAQGGSAIAAKAIDADFWAPGIPVLAMSTGAVRVLNFDFKFDNSPVANRLKNPGEISPYLVADGGKQLAAERLSAVQTTDSKDMPIWLRPYEAYLASSKTLPQRCAKMARILGIEMEYRFWLMIDYYLNGEQGESSKVPLSLGFFSSDTEFKEDALDSLRRQISLAETSKQRRRLADILGCYGDQESAAAALLASQTNDPLFIQDWLKYVQNFVLILAINSS